MIELWLVFGWWGKWWVDCVGVVCVWYVCWVGGVVLGGVGWVALWGVGVMVLYCVGLWCRCVWCVVVVDRWLRVVVWGGVLDQSMSQDMCSVVSSAAHPNNICASFPRLISRIWKPGRWKKNVVRLKENIMRSMIIIYQWYTIKKYSSKVVDGSRTIWLKSNQTKKLKSKANIAVTWTRKVYTETVHGDLWEILSEV